MKITTELQRNAKLLHLLNEEVICLTLTDKKIQFRAKIGRGRSRVSLRTALKRFCFKMEHFSPNMDFQDYENETPSKRIIKITDEELEKSIDALFLSRFTRHMTRTPELTDHGNRKNNAGFLHEFGYGN